eukprot:747182-Hanusia_phi.AAC.1
MSWEEGREPFLAPCYHGDRSSSRIRQDLFVEMSYESRRKSGETKGMRMSGGGNEEVGSRLQQEEEGKEEEGQMTGRERNTAT